MVISELALSLFTNLLYESFKNIPEYISDASSKVYDKAIEEFSNKNYKLTGIQIDTFFRQKNVEKAIKKYLKSPDKLDCSNIEALGNIKSDTAVEPLINALKDEDPWVRSSVSQALKKLCTVKSKKQLNELLKSDNEYSANTAFEILYEIEKEERSKVVLFKDEKFLKT